MQLNLDIMDIYTKSYKTEQDIELLLNYVICKLIKIDKISTDGTFQDGSPRYVVNFYPG